MKSKYKIHKFKTIILIMKFYIMEIKIRAKNNLAKMKLWKQKKKWNQLDFKFIKRYKLKLTPKTKT